VVRKWSLQIHHDLDGQTGLLQLLACCLDVLGLVVGSLGRAAENYVRRVVADRLDNGGETLLRDRQEGVRGCGGLDGVHGDVDRAVLPSAQASHLKQGVGHEAIS